MSWWEAVSVVCRVGVALIVIVKLTRFRDLYKPTERVGLGIAGGCSLMTVPVVLDGYRSPFAEWAAALFAFGVMVYFAGRLMRQMRHERANREQIRRAQERIDLRSSKP